MLSGATTSTLTNQTGIGRPGEGRDSGNVVGEQEGGEEIRRDRSRKGVKFKPTLATIGEDLKHEVGEELQVPSNSRTNNQPREFIIQEVTLDSKIDHHHGKNQKLEGSQKGETSCSISDSTFNFQSEGDGKITVSRSQRTGDVRNPRGRDDLLHWLWEDLEERRSTSPGVVSIVTSTPAFTHYNINIGSSTITPTCSKPPTLASRGAPEEMEPEEMESKPTEEDYPAKPLKPVPRADDSKKGENPLVTEADETQPRMNEGYLRAKDNEIMCCLWEEYFGERNTDYEIDSRKPYGTTRNEGATTTSEGEPAEREKQSPQKSEDRPQAVDNEVDSYQERESETDDNQYPNPNKESDDQQRKGELRAHAKEQASIAEGTHQLISLFSITTGAFALLGRWGTEVAMTLLMNGCGYALSVTIYCIWTITTWALCLAYQEHWELEEKRTKMWKQVQEQTAASYRKLRHLNQTRYQEFQQRFVWRKIREECEAIRKTRDELDREEHLYSLFKKGKTTQANEYSPKMALFLLIAALGVGYTGACSWKVGLCMLGAGFGILGRGESWTLLRRLPIASNQTGRLEHPTGFSSTYHGYMNQLRDTRTSPLQDEWREALQRKREGGEAWASLDLSLIHI